MSEVKVKIKDHLKKLGIEKLKPQQKEAITGVINGKDIIATLPTGFGKSLTYILPHMITNKLVIVVTPLISLMKDQQRRYEKVCKVVISYGQLMCCNGEILDDEARTEIYDGKMPCVIYMTPENFIKRKLWLIGMQKYICLIAIDECHCISSWSDFRDGYANMKDIKNWFIEDPPSIMGLTGTATKETIQEVSKSLGFINPLTIHVSPTRDNLYLSVFQKSKMQEFITKVRKLINGKTIIYCKTRNDTEKISEKLRFYHIKAGYYHAGMEDDDRNQMQNLFTNGTINVMCATVAFGMGIDISDIETIVHFGIPKDIESYCQEIGRAARQKDLIGNCYIFWGKSDFIINNIFLRQIQDDNLRKKQKMQMSAMENFVKTNHACRMVMISNYFGHANCPKCGKCDYCLR